MGKKIFVSYKYGDSNVFPLDNKKDTTARHYVDKLQDLFGDKAHINKGEKDDESLEEFKDETIRGKLSDKIFDSTVTVVLISPNMVNISESELEQWIPWEISYSLKNKKRTDQNGNDKCSSMNAIIAVVLPDKNNSYLYYIQEKSCPHCNCRTLKTNTLFKILSKNMFNIKEPRYSDCEHHKNKVYTGQASYISSIKWCDFITKPDVYIKNSLEINKKQEEYNIFKKLDSL